MRVLDFIATAALVMALFALPFSLYNFYRRPMGSLLVFCIPLFIFLGATNTSREIAQRTLRQKLNGFSEKYRISINGSPASNPNDTLMTMKTLSWLPPHHSNPTSRVNVEISDDSRQIVFSLARDSSNPQEYWVFYPKYVTTRYNSVGRIVTPLFDNY